MRTTIRQSLIGNFGIQPGVDNEKLRINQNSRPKSTSRAPAREVPGERRNKEKMKNFEIFDFLNAVEQEIYDFGDFLNSGHSREPLRPALWAVPLPI